MSVELNQVVAVVLAGGFGTRIQHLLSGVPKPMAPFGDRPFLEWVVRYLAKQGITRAIISTGYLADVVEKHFSQHQVPGVTVSCIAETAPLGTGGGFLHAVNSTGNNRPDAWLVLNGDSLIFANLHHTAERLDSPGAKGVIVGRSLEDAARFGTLILDDNGSLMGFEEKRPGAGIINAGVYLLRDEVVRQFPQRTPLSLERDVFPALTTQRGLLKVHVVNAPFLDIGTPETLPQAEVFLRENHQQFALA